ncbi:Rv1476 family membrane protein [Nocardia callitridis]|uniref:TPM domain-containing protein n=1 Tax=Nocardia callitridis TaxID=648753 RepID=A0ABP9KD13_9NOCA
MTVSHTSVFLPMAAELPPYMTEATVKTINADLADDHVATMTGKDKPKLAQIAAEARANGIPLSIVVLPSNPERDSSLRDLAIELSKTQHGTVAVFSDDWMGTDSDAISRVRLEHAEDKAKFKGGGHSAEAAQAFVTQLEQPERIPWVGFTAVLIAITVVLVAGLYFVKSRREPEVATVAGEQVAGEHSARSAAGS